MPFSPTSSSQSAFTGARRTVVVIVVGAVTAAATLTISFGSSYATGDDALVVGRTYGELTFERTYRPASLFGPIPRLAPLEPRLVHDPAVDAGPLAPPPSPPALSPARRLALRLFGAQRARTPIRSRPGRRDVTAKV